ncbi:hypothetical protein QN354_09395 [Cryobacterium sp. 5I3]|uniref:hypothetical protein n=1 Tax=Cryobacterium sp. 5I3 TaxID=3048592 RepID=UPI002B23964F|nr:hypothetical protein [Cryobacterium sp. 5I3]MEB0201969.1 hypothetical protein [Cryobacterium sp. 5I3]
MDGDKELGAGKTCFIISPIGSKLEPAGTPGRTRYEESAFMWESVILPACEAFGLTPIRADKISDAGEIPDQIFTYLRDADVVIADVSHANPNVMYELGLRHSRPGITLQIGEYKLLPFDVTTIRTIQFNRTEAGLIGAKNDLQDALRTALSGGGTPLRVTSIWGNAPVPPESRVAADAEASVAPEEQWGTEAGSVDILADGERAIQNISEVMGDTTALIASIGQVMAEHTAAINDSDSNQGGFAGRVLVARKLNAALIDPASTFESNSNAFYEDVLTLGEMAAYVVDRLNRNDDDDAGREDLKTLAEHFIKLALAADTGAVGSTTFRESIRGLRSFSKDLRPSLQVLDRAVSRFLEGLGVMSAWRAPLSEAIA